MDNKQKILLGVGAAVLFGAVKLFASSKKNDVEVKENTSDREMSKGLTYAVFNKNFGNIRNAGRKYAGEITPPNNIYKKFSSWEYGAAAMVAHLQRYIKGVTSLGKLDTIKKIIYTYAPPSENKTADYVAFVERNTGINRDTVLNHTDKATMFKLAKTMSRMEDNNATVFFTEAVFNAAWSIAQTQNS
jgi:hypothetical protein